MTPYIGLKINLYTINFENDSVIYQFALSNTRTSLTANKRQTFPDSFLGVLATYVSLVCPLK